MASHGVKVVQDCVHPQYCIYIYTYIYIYICIHIFCPPSEVEAQITVLEGGVREVGSSGFVQANELGVSDVKLHCHIGKLLRRGDGVQLVVHSTRAS